MELDTILQDGITKEVGKFSRSLFVVDNLLKINNERELTQDEELTLDKHSKRLMLLNASTICLLSETQYKRAIQLNNNAYRRYNRLYNYIFDMVGVYPKKTYFLTLTFRDNVLNRYDYTTKKDLELIQKIIKNYLKEQCLFYIANIDFGTSDFYIDDKGQERTGTHRLHYHAIVVPKKKIDLKKWSKLYGNIDCKKVKTQLDDAKKLGQYITKLTRHSSKKSTQKNKCIYSRHLNVLRPYKIGLDLFGDILKVEGVEV